MADDLGERTEEATPKRRQEARDEGNVARSQDFSGALMLLLVTLVLWAAGASILGQGTLLVEHALSGSLGGDMLSVESAWSSALAVGAWAVRLAVPVLLAAWAAGYVVNVVQVGWLVSPKAVRPQLGKLDPVKGAQRLFGLTALVRASLDLAKVTVVVAVTALTVLQHGERMVALPQLDLLPALAEIARMVLDLSLRILAVLVVLGVLDLVYQRWKHGRDLRMTKQQVKDEMKQTEGDPEVKRRRIRMQQQIALQRISAAVPRADVIVTNPEHVAVAIRYEEGVTDAPVLVAKGGDHLALRIRQIAMRHEIPIVERKPLARALYRAVDVGGEVPADLYTAVAEILAYVYSLRKEAA